MDLAALQPKILELTSFCLLYMLGWVESGNLSTLKLLHCSLLLFNSFSLQPSKNAGSCIAVQQ